MGGPSVTSYYFYHHYHFHSYRLTILPATCEPLIIEHLGCAQRPVQLDSKPTIQTVLMCPQVHVRCHQVSFHQITNSPPAKTLYAFSPLATSSAYNSLSSSAPGTAHYSLRTSVQHHLLSEAHLDWLSFF